MSELTLKSIGWGYYCYLKANGMLWERFPEATGNWAEDSKLQAVNSNSEVFRGSGSENLVGVDTIA